MSYALISGWYSNKPSPEKKARRKKKRIEKILARCKKREKDGTYDRLTTSSFPRAHKQ